MIDMDGNFYTNGGSPVDFDRDFNDVCTFQYGTFYFCGEWFAIFGRGEKEGHGAPCGVHKRLPREHAGEFGGRQDIGLVEKPACGMEL